MDIRKDTDRQEEIRALKHAWEAAEPGRAIKVFEFNYDDDVMLGD